MCLAIKSSPNQLPIYNWRDERLIQNLATIQKGWGKPTNRFQQIIAKFWICWKQVVDFPHPFCIQANKRKCSFHILWIIVNVVNIATYLEWIEDSTEPISLP